MKIKYSIAVIVCALTFCGTELLLANPPDRAAEDKDLQKFFRLRRKLQEDIKDTQRNKVNFAIGEYYFKVNDFTDAQQTFEDYLSHSPVGITTFLAKVYLYKIAKINGNQGRMNTIKKEMFQNRFILLFDQYKILKDASLFDNKYEVHYFVDRIKIFLNGDVFEEISP